MREELANNARIDSGVYALALDPTRSLVAPLKKQRCHILTLHR